MKSISVEVTGLSNELSNIRLFGLEIINEVSLAVEESATAIQFNSKIKIADGGNMPWQTGNLSRSMSIKYGTGRLSAAIGTNINYAEIQERKHQFLAKAYDKERPIFEKNIKKILNENSAK